MKSIVSILLIVAGLFFAYLAISTFQASTASVSFLGIDLSASDEGGQTTAILYGVVAVVCFVLGGLSLRGGK